MQLVYIGLEVVHTPKGTIPLDIGARFTGFIAKSIR